MSPAPSRFGDPGSRARRRDSALLLQPEVGGQSPPDAVDVVRGVPRPIVLHVEELHYESGTLDLVRLPLARLRTAAVPEINLFDAGVLRRLQFGRTHGIRHAVRVGLHQPYQNLALLVGELATGNAYRGPDLGRRIVLGDLGERLVPMRERLLITVQRLDQFLGAIFHFRQRPKPHPGTGLDRGRVSPEQERRRGIDLPAIEREVDRQVMAFEPPPPFARLGGLAEHANEVPVRIPDHRTLLLHVAEDLLETHDRGCLFVALCTRPGLQQRESLLPLLLVQLLEPETFAGRLLLAVLLWRDGPNGPVRALEVKLGLLPKLRRKAGKELVRRFGHLVTRGPLLAGQERDRGEPA